MVGMLSAIGRVAGRIGSEAIDRKKEEVKAKREMQLQQLQNQFLGEQGNLNRGLQERQIASTENLTKAQIAANERSDALARETQKGIATLQAGSSEKIAGMNVALGRDQLKVEVDKYKEQIAAQKDIAGSQIAAQKDIAEFEADARQKLGITERTTKDGKVILMRPDGTKVALPNDESGKEIDLANADASTPEMKNLTALMLIPGMTQQKAVDYIYGAKADSPTQIQMDFFEAMSKSKPFGTTTEDLQNWMTLSGEFRDQVIAAREAAMAAPPGTAPGATPAPAAPPASAATPAPPKSVAISPPIDASGKPDMTKMIVDQPYLIGGRTWVKTAEGGLREVSVAPATGAPPGG
jgi:hypothetical protein